VGEADDDALLEDADRSDLAGHATARAAVRLAGRVHARQARPELLVGRELVEQAALEAAAVAEQAVVGQRHVLGLVHLHRDRIDASQGRRAAELAAARPDAVQDVRPVPRADLAHLAPQPRLARALGPADRAGHVLGRGLDEHEVAAVQLEVAHAIVVGLSGGPKSDANEALVHILYPMPPAERGGSARFRG